MIIFVYHCSGSNKSRLEDIVDNHEDVKFISISDYLAKNYDNSENKLALVKGRVIKSHYGRHPKKGNYMKIFLIDVSKRNGTIIAVYMYKKAVIREKIQAGDLLGLNESNLAPFHLPGVCSDSEDSFEITTNDNTFSKNPSIWVLTKSAPLHTYDYTALNEIKDAERHAIFGVVMTKEPVCDTRGTSFICCMKIRDKSIDSEFNLNVFLNEETDLPEINCGDIIQCYIKGGKLNSRPCGTVFAPKHCAIWSGNVYGNLVPKTSSSTYAMTAAEEKIVVEFREWVAQKFFHLLFVSPGKERKPQPLLLLKSLSAVQEGEYFDLVCQVIEVFSLPNCVVVRVWDGTKSEINTFPLTMPPIDKSFALKGKEITNYVVDLHVYGEHGEAARRLNTEDIILMRNVHCTANKYAAPDVRNEMKLQLHEGNRYGRTIISCNPGQSIEFKRKLDDVLTKCGNISERYDFVVYGYDRQFQSSFEMHTQDLSPDVLQKVMERRAKEKEMDGSLCTKDVDGNKDLDSKCNVINHDVKPAEENSAVANDADKVNTNGDCKVKRKKRRWDDKGPSSGNVSKRLSFDDDPALSIDQPPITDQSPITGQLPITEQIPTIEELPITGPVKTERFGMNEQLSYAMYTQDLSQDILDKVMKRRAEEKEMHELCKKQKKDVREGLNDKNEDLSDYSEDLSDYSEDLGDENQDLSEKNKDSSDRKQDLNDKNEDLSDRKEGLIEKKDLNVKKEDANEISEDSNEEKENSNDKNEDLNHENEDLNGYNDENQHLSDKNACTVAGNTSAAEDKSKDINNTEENLNWNADNRNDISIRGSRPGRYFVLVLQSSGAHSKSKDDNDDDVQVEGIFPYKRNNPVTADIDLTETADSENEEPPPPVPSNPPTRLSRFSIDLIGNTIPLSTLENVSFSSVGEQHRIRVKVRDINPSVVKSVLNILHLQCPICLQSKQYVQNMDLICRQCCEKNPLQNYMEYIYQFKFLAQDRTGSLPITLTGSSAEIFFGIAPLQLLECKKSRSDLEEMLSFICPENDDGSDFLNCENPWLDFIVETVDQSDGKAHCIIQTKCNLKSSPKKQKKTRKRKMPFWKNH